MEEQHPETPSESSDANALDPFEELEERVIAMVAELREARKARLTAESEAATLRERCQDFEMEIALLKKKLEGDDLRTTVRTRVEALLQRIDEMEQDR